MAKGKAQVRKRNGTDITTTQDSRSSFFELVTAQNILFLVGLIGMVTSAYHWYHIQTALTREPAIAITSTLILVLAPPALLAFLFPTSPGAMLLQKSNARTWGYALITLCAVFVVYYSVSIQWAWWSAQTTVSDANIILQQVVLHLVGTICIPALVIAPVSGQQLAEQIRQQRQVEQYEAMQATREAVAAANRKRMIELTLRGVSSLTRDEYSELSASMRALIAGIDEANDEIGKSYQRLSSVSLPIAHMQERPEVVEFFERMERQAGLPDGTLDDVAEEVADQLTGDQEPETRPRRPHAHANVGRRPTRPGSSMRQRVAATQARRRYE